MNKPDYKNWIPKWMIMAGMIGVALSLILLVIFALVLNGTTRIILSVIFALVFAFMCVYLVWCIFANKVFSYERERKLSKSIIDGISDYIDLADGGVALDVGCGSGALSIAVAKKIRTLKSSAATFGAKVELINTADGKFMSSKEANRMFLSGSMLLVGIK